MGGLEVFVQVAKGNGNVLLDIYDWIDRSLVFARFHSGSLGEEMDMLMPISDYQSCF